MANQRMLGFVHTAQRMPDKRPASERREDFAEIYARFSDERANEQANRCSQCGVPFCQVHCPVSNNIPDWLKLTAEGRLEEAYEVSQATNNFPEICGRICPQDRLCEGNCVIEQSTHGAVTIGSVEKYINDTAWDNGWVKPRKPARELGLSVGVIGAGPAGLAAAEELRAKGYEVHVYDRYDRMGGLLVYGIPGFKLEKNVVERRVQLLADAGVVFHPNFEVGRDATLPELRRRHVAVLVATGVYKARDIQAPGCGLGNIVPALEYLTTSNKVGLGDTVEAYADGSLNAAGKKVVVLGGGDTAMDCVRTAIRQGATSVKCLYRRDRKNMPGSQREVAHAEEEGVEFIWQAAPEGFTGDSVVTGVRAVRIHLGVADATGRQTPQVIEGSEFTVEADLVIKALGFEPEDLPAMFAEPELKVTRWGTLPIDFRSKMTNLDGVFAAGDIVRGASLVVWAIRDGRDAADAIHAYAQAKAETLVAQAAE
ncbi:NAD(P)-dependent oxidoreductase [Azospirillum rugosum]|uniref:Glutamate synthase (NADPH/NADH) small chain n=1 Tax=Azospirillum rugosum TaxID=416170 RepID=A0ABS4SH69_9PROT|nr:NAD(P)-dependent oxidoreductase [Azospirillum rugosum]MBP2291852.1 glutamate synthase (NADPH/NADH) small chain [Azospirillum rugosum]MDQ0524336.1 glutamate synthase (NADPH/NADH) small chain [Azospirillum rugosum]